MHATYTNRPGRNPRTGKPKGQRTPVGMAPAGTTVGSTIFAYGNPAKVVSLATNRFGQPAVAAKVLGTNRLVYLLPHNPVAGGVAWAVHSAPSQPTTAASPQPVAQGHYYGGRGNYGQDLL